jgi:hypothetical protein
MTMFTASLIADGVPVSTKKVNMKNNRTKKRVVFPPVTRSCSVTHVSMVDKDGNEFTSLLRFAMEVGPDVTLNFEWTD